MQSIRSARNLSLLAGGASLMALAYAHPAVAQQSAQSDQPSASNSGGLEEIVVTARRKEEKAQSVPIAITNISANQMEEQRVLNPSDFTKELTGFSTLTTGNRNVSGISVGGNIGNGYQWIRGIPGVIPYWADAPTVTSGGLLFDVASAQLLKGPQGTLFGVATNGGAIVFQPHLPTNSFEGFVNAELGDFNHSNLSGVVNIPVIDDKLLVRVGGRIVHTDGFVYDIAHKVWLGSEGNKDGRLAVTIRPTEDIQNDFIGNAYNYGDTPTLSTYRYVNLAARPLAPIPFSAVNVYAALAPNTCGLTRECLVTYGGPLGWYAVNGNANNPASPWESGHWYNMVNTTRWDINDNLTVKNIMSYTEGGSGQGYAAAQATLSFSPATFGQDIHSWPTGVGIQATDEFQILGRALNDKLSYTAGAFKLFTQGSSAPHIINIQCSRVTNGPAGGVLAGGVASSCSGTATYVNARTHAVYAQGNYDLSDWMEGLTFTAGYRYSWDSNYASVYQYGGTPQNGPSKPQVITGVLAGWAQGESSHAGSYNLSLDWQIDPKTLVYVTNSKGYSRGGLNATASLGAGPGRSFDPESVSNIEAGIKADWDLPLDMRARTNVSLFYGMYDNVQASKLQPNTDAVGNVATTVVTANAANGHVDGIDFDLTLLPTDDIQLSGGGVWVNNVYDTYNFCVKLVNGVCQTTADYTHSVYVMTPRWTWHVRAAYVLPVDESVGKITVAANLSHIGPYYGSVGVNCTAINTPVGCPLPTIENINPPTNNVDMSVSWNEFLGRKGLDLHAYVNNLLSAHYGQGGVPTYDSSGSTTIPVGMPRNYGVGLKYAFGP